MKRSIDLSSESYHWYEFEPLSGAAQRRYLQLLAAALLGFGLSGVLLVSALDHPGEAGRWVLFGGWVVVIVAFRIAWRRFRRDRDTEPPSE